MVGNTDKISMGGANFLLTNARSHRLRQRQREI